VLLGRIAIASLIITVFSVAYATDTSSVSSEIQKEIGKRFPNSRIELTDDLHWTSSIPEGKMESIEVGAENGRAQVGFTVETRDSQGTHRGYGYASFAAWMRARIATRRIMPGEKLRDDQFTIREVNVASGVEHEFRGVIYNTSEKIQKLQARQTVLEGQPLLSSAIERVPDVRQGDPVRVHIISHGLTLSTQAVAAEPGFINSSLKVLTDRTKRELFGKLVANDIVEVRL
jgi:flagella basal body P-ring formation protein FlgA